MLPNDALNWSILWNIFLKYKIIILYNYTKSYSNLVKYHLQRKVLFSSFGSFGTSTCGDISCCCFFFFCCCCCCYCCCCLLLLLLLQLFLFLLLFSSVCVKMQMFLFEKKKIIAKSDFHRQWSISKAKCEPILPVRCFTCVKIVKLCIVTRSPIVYLSSFKHFIYQKERKGNWTFTFHHFTHVSPFSSSNFSYQRK